MNIKTKTKLPEVPRIKSRAYRAALEKLGAAVARIPSIEDKYAMTTAEKINREPGASIGENVPQG